MLCVGIDVAKNKHTVAIIDENGEIRKKPFNISNTLEGYNSLVNEMGLLGPKEQIKIGMEATGHYMTCISKFLVNKGYNVHIYNPFLIHRFKESETNNGAKTDKLDSIMIAKYVSMHTFASSPQISYNIEQIRKITRAKYFLFGDKVRAINRLQRYLDEVFPELIPFLNSIYTSKGRHVLESSTVKYLLSNYALPQKMAGMRIETAEKLRKMSKGSISFNRFSQLKELGRNSIGQGSDYDEEVIRSLINQIEIIDSQIDKMSEQLVPLMEKINSPIMTIPGMGINLAATIIGEIGDINRFDNPEKLIKYAGLDVKIYQSGTINLRGKVTKKGSSILRYALALSVQKMRIHCPVFYEYYHSKIRQGKHVNVAIIATTRKLIRVIWKMMKTNSVFENIQRN